MSILSRDLVPAEPDPGFELPAVRAPEDDGPVAGANGGAEAEQKPESHEPSDEASPDASEAEELQRLRREIPECIRRDPILHAAAIDSLERLVPLDADVGGRRERLAYIAALTENLEGLRRVSPDVLMDAACPGGWR